MLRYVKATAIVVICLVLTIGAAMAYAPSLDITHQHGEHQGQVVDVEYGDHHDVVWSLDEGGTFAAYVVGDEDVEFTWDFDQGHALATSEEAVYIAAGDTLWEFDVPDGEFNEIGTLDAHPEDMAYDAERNVVWIGGHGTIHGYNVDDGSEYMNYTEHSEGIGVIDVAGDYVVSGTTWETEVVVYDVESEEVVYEPELPDDTQGVSAINLLDSDSLLIGAIGDDADDLVAGYDIDEEQRLLEHREHIFGISYVGYDPHNDLIISAGLDNTVKFYDHETDQIVEEYQHDDTIYTASYDYPNSLLWFGDGEEGDGYVSGLDIHYEAAADDDDTADDMPGDDDPADDSDDAPADDADDGPTDDTADDSADDADDTTVDDDDDGSPGFGPLAVFLAFGSLVYLKRRFEF